MKVVLLRDLPEENWPSIQVYADRLVQGLRATAPGLEIAEMRLPAWSWPTLSLPTPYGRRASLHTLGLYLSRWIRYPLALRKLQADLYHILDNSYGHLAFFLDPRRTVVTSHGGTPSSWRQWNPEGPAMWVFDLAFKGMLRANHVIAVSEYAKQELLAEADYPPDAVHVVSHGIDPIFHPLPGDSRARWREKLLPSSDDSYLLLHIGHSAPRKNLEVLYQALAILCKQRQPVDLVRVGGIPSPSQARLIENLSIASAITHVPYVPNQKLPSYYAAADVFVFPSLYEGFGIPLIEAMACGTPVICSDRAPFDEVCGEAAYFVDTGSPEALAQAIREVLVNPALAEDLRRRGLKRAERFTWERTAQKTLQVYRTIWETVSA
jgi:glycosyltransferase involved in cell wall biosynthesis